MKYIITKTEAMRPYFGMSENDPNMYCKDLYTLFDLSCVEIAEPLFDTIYPTIPVGYEEVTATEAKYGTLFFSEVRDTVKIWNNEYGWAETADIRYCCYRLRQSRTVKTYRPLAFQYWRISSFKFWGNGT